MATTVFDYPGAWSAMFPELVAAGVTLTLATGYFARACLVLSPLDGGLVCDPPRGTILNLITAHIAALNAPLNGEPSSPLVGRISNASEGSVSVATAYEVPGSAAWYAQSKYGAEAWNALAPFRQARWAPGPGARRNFRGAFGFRGF